MTLLHILRPIEIEKPNGERFYIEVCREDDKLVTGTFTNNTFLRDQWEVSIEEYSSEQEALEELYHQLEEYARTH
jgi:hypothetical protein